MIFLYLVVAAAWCFFWVKGRLWAALPVPVFLAVATYDDVILHHVEYGADHWISIVLLAVAFFIPYAIRRYRAEKADRLLNGVRFNYRD